MGANRANGLLGVLLGLHGGEHWHADARSVKRRPAVTSLSIKLNHAGDRGWIVAVVSASSVNEGIGLAVVRERGADFDTFCGDGLHCLSLDAPHC